MLESTDSTFPANKLDNKYTITIRSIVWEASLTGHLPLLLCELYDVEVVSGGLGADTHPGEVPLQEVAGDSSNIESEEDSK